MRSDTVFGKKQTTPTSQKVRKYAKINRRESSLNSSEIFKSFMLSAESGDPVGQCCVGSFYEIGIGVTKDLAASLRWYRRAADQGFSRAQFSIGQRYEYGQGVIQNFAEAAQWYKRAADGGVPEAQNNLGAFYLDGQGVEKDEATGFRYFKLAADQGYPLAIFGLGGCYELGNGVEKNVDIAMRHYIRAAKLGSVEAKELLEDIITKSTLVRKKKKMLLSLSGQPILLATENR